MIIGHGVFYFEDIVCLRVFSSVLLLPFFYPLFYCISSYLPGVFESVLPIISWRLYSETGIVGTIVFIFLACDG